MLGGLPAVEIIDGPGATRPAVLSALRRCRRAHFACHAVSDLDDPSAGYLELHDHQEIWRLTVADVAPLRLDRVGLAYLSACSTFQTGVELADESIHLGSAFQLAGYRHVIATLWPTLDSAAERIARMVYGGIAGPTGLAATASALHRATRHERDRAPDAPSIWAAHVHSGA